MSTRTPPGTVVLVDGRRQRGGSVVLAWDDPGLARGHGVFETIAVLKGRAVLLQRHLSRLAKGATALGMVPPDLDALGTQVVAVVSDEAVLQGTLRIQLTAHGHIILALSAPRPRRLRATAATLEWPAPPFPPADVKHTSRAGAVLACRAKGVDEVLRVDRLGRVREGTWSNAFCLRNGTVFTAPLDGKILPGVTREVVIEACGIAGIAVVEAPPVVGPGAWFLSSALQGIVPVTCLDGAKQHVPSVVTTLRAVVDDCVGRPTVELQS